MPRRNRGQSDQLFRSRSRNAAQRSRQEKPWEQEDRKRSRQIRSWLILVGIVVALLLGYRFLRREVRGEITASRLPCYSNQNVTPFGEGVLYYDGVSLHCLNSSGAIRWSFPAGERASFYAGPRHVAIWSGMQMYLVDENGNSTYN